MRFVRAPRVQRLVARLVLAAVACAAWPAAAEGGTRAERAARLDAVLAHPEAVRTALAAADAAPSPETAVGAFARAYHEATGREAPPEAVARAVADVFLGRSLRPVPPPEVKLSAAGPAASGTPTSTTGAVVVPAHRVSAPAALAGRVAAEAVPTSAAPSRLTPPARAP